jgi:small subunit ribosomal protein S13
MKQKEFNYIVRIVNTDLDGSKQVPYALTKIKGINQRVAFFVVDKANINRNAKIGLLSEEDVSKLESTIGSLHTTAPNWLVNRRKDRETGENKHLVGNDLDLSKGEDINLERKIHAYKGVRHELGLRVRGQKTKAHPRKGLVVGVVRAKLVRKEQKRGKTREGEKKRSR